MLNSEITLWGERGLVASMLIDLVRLAGVGHWDHFFSEIIDGTRPLEAPIRSVMIIVEPDFSNTGFGHPDAMLRLELESGTSTGVILEAKRNRYIKSCKPPGARGTRGYNSSLNGQLELNHCLANALAAYQDEDQDLYEPAWILNTPYSQDRCGNARGVRSSVVLDEIVRPFSGIPLSGFMHVVITTDSSNPFVDSDCQGLLPELFAEDSLDESRWDRYREMFGWTSWWRVARFFAALEAAGSLTDSLFLPTFTKNRRNLHGRERTSAIPLITILPTSADASARAELPREVNLAGSNEIRRLCNQFIARMSGNRPNCNDAGVAEQILRDLDDQGRLTARTRRRLTHWCHTEGTLYEAGIPLARAICEALYGRVLPRED